MKKLNHLLIIPDGGRRYARREYLADLFRESPEKFQEALNGFPNENRFSEEDFSALERRINSYVITSKDPFYEYGLSEDLLDTNKIHAPQDYLLASYRKGGEAFDKLIKHILERGICNILSIYALQKRNLDRTDEETYALLKTEPEVFRRWAKDEKISSQCNFKFVGNPEIFELHKHRPRLKEEIEEYADSINELEKKGNGNKLKVYVLAPYDSCWEINQAIVNGKFHPNNLVVKESVDLIIRCGNLKVPISGGLPYQTQFAQFTSVREYPADLTIDALYKALNEYEGRERESGL